ncbi:MAG TPA: DoxX family protein [Dermatophilaceae bacterium]|nr:DoxX family protein [Dermatophilaceae bacterium]
MNLQGGGRRADFIGLLARLILGVVLIVAGALKVTSPAVSARAVQAFRLLPFDFAGYVGYALPVVEIAVGLLLVIGLFTRASAMVGGLLMLAFIIGISWAWAHGYSIDCGCFGGGGTIEASQTQYPLDILRDTGLVACAAWLVARPRTTFSLDHRLFG